MRYTNRRILYFTLLNSQNHDQSAVSVPRTVTYSDAQKSTFGADLKVYDESDIRFVEAHAQSDGGDE